MVSGALIIGLAQKVSAETTISPTWLELELGPDSTSTTSAVSIANTSQNTLTVTLSAFEIRQEDEFGSVSFVTQPQVQSNSFNTFFSFNPSTFELQPNQKKSVSVSVRNSPDLKPGGHYASLLAKLTTDESLPQPRISPALSTLVLLRKTGGERYQLSLTNLEELPQGFFWQLPSEVALTFQNDGNVHDRPYGRIEIFDGFGRLVRQSPINIGSAFVLPQNRRQISHQLRSVEPSLPVGIFRLHIAGRAERGLSTLAQETVFFYLDWRLLLVIAVSMAGSLFWLLKRRRLANV
jgi:hypothetical protein